MYAKSRQVAVTKCPHVFSHPTDRDKYIVSLTIWAHKEEFREEDLLLQNIYLPELHVFIVRGGGGGGVIQNIEWHSPLPLPSLPPSLPPSSTQTQSENMNLIM